MLKRLDVDESELVSEDDRLPPVQVEAETVESDTDAAEEGNADARAA